MGLQMTIRTNEDLTPRELIRCLVSLRFLAKRVILNLRAIRDMQASRRCIQEDLPEWLIAALKEDELALNFKQIEVGQQLMSLCDLLDRKVNREAVFDALNTSKAHRDTDMVRQYGQKTIHLISVLDLENSATKDDGIEIRPLKWCCSMAMLHAMQTSPKLDRAIHDGANELFDGAFGEYCERPLMDRLAGVAV